MMNMCAVAGLASSGTRCATASIFRSALTRPMRRSGDRRSGRVGGELARPRDRRLDQAGRERRQDHHEQQRRGVRALAIVAAAAEEHREPRRHHDRRRDCRGHRADENVAVFHVRELVSDHAIEFFRAEGLQDPLGGGHRGMLRIASGRKRVGRAVGNDIHARHRQSGALGSRATVAYSGCPAPTSCARYMRRTILSEKKYDTKLVPAAKRNASSRPLCAAERLADEQQQRAQHRQEHRRFQSVGHGCVKAGVSATPADQSIYVVHAGAVPRPAPPPTGGFKDVLPGCASNPILAKAPSPITTPRADGKFPAALSPAVSPGNSATALKPPAPRFCLARIVPELMDRECSAQAYVRRPPNQPPRYNLTMRPTFQQLGVLWLIASAVTVSTANAQATPPPVAPPPPAAAAPKAAPTVIREQAPTEQQLGLPLFPDSQFIRSVRCGSGPALLPVRNEGDAGRGGRLLPHRPQTARRHRVRAARDLHVRGRPVPSGIDGVPARRYRQGFHVGRIGWLSEPDPEKPAGALSNGDPDGRGVLTRRRPIISDAPRPVSRVAARLRPASGRRSRVPA